MDRHCELQQRVELEMLARIRTEISPANKILRKFYGCNAPPSYVTTEEGDLIRSAYATGMGRAETQPASYTQSMNLSRSVSKSISRMLIGVLLFAQFAVAGYACPILSGRASMSKGNAATVVLVAAAADAAFAPPAAMPPGCEEMDTAFANLCAEHCRFGQQSADTAPAPVVHAAIPTFLYSLPFEPAHALGSGRSIPAPDACLAAAPEPPHAILHCVFRI